MKIVIVSNGHGEDMIATVLAKELGRLGYGVQAVPLVGKGMAYLGTGVEVLGPRKEMPSGGFAIQSAAAVWADVRAGWFSMSAGHYRAVRAAARGAVATLVVGDIYGILVGSVFGRMPLFQMQCLVSVRAWERDRGGNPYGPLERILMRRAVRVYPRELEAQQWLRANGVGNAEYLGNPMLDALEGVPLELPPPYLLLLPGSRTDAYESLPMMLEAYRLLGDTGLTPVVAWAGLPVDERVAGSGWRVAETGQAEGVTHRLEHPDGTLAYLTQGAFRSCVLGARVALSTSGTAAEQAAGYGVPVVGFPTAGPQYTRPFAQNQKRLLGDALALVESRPEAVAGAVRAFLASEELRGKARAAGKAAMGEPGAARRIAEDIHRQLLRGARPV
ncbi:MAG: lipid-A-disaccharide synthase-related protein [Meiothermus sp.]|nr:lipid-A-disaccharide synthase-related protein [Meiothermus sp.]